MNETELLTLGCSALFVLRAGDMTGVGVVVRTRVDPLLSGFFRSARISKNRPADDDKRDHCDEEKEDSAKSEWHGHAPEYPSLHARNEFTRLVPASGDEIECLSTPLPATYVAQT
jgi:hypothetical protein